MSKKAGMITRCLLLTFIMLLVSPARATVNPEIPFEFVSIPPGTFMMGSPETEANRQDNEGPRHLVTISEPFEMQTTDVTQRHWYQVMGNNPSAIRNRPECRDTFTIINGVSLCPYNPVEKVSWDDVQIFIGKLNVDGDGYHYRLPTEAEWEYAARAGTQTAYPFGEDPKLLDKHGWYYGNSIIQVHWNPPGFKSVTFPVGKLPPNNFGLYDMTGNVWQWVQDYYGDYPDPSSRPTLDRTIRGGSHLDDAGNCRSAARRNDAFGGHVAWSDTGFRVVRTPR